MKRDTRKRIMTFVFFSTLGALRVTNALSALGSGGMGNGKFLVFVAVRISEAFSPYTTDYDEHCEHVIGLSDNKIKNVRLR